MSIQTNERLRGNKGFANDGIFRYKRYENDKRFFTKPRLVIEHDEKKYPSIFAPEQTYTPQNIHRTFLRIYIKNKGARIAERCKATLIAIKTIPRQYPSIQEVALTWDGSTGNVNMNTSLEKDIQPYSKSLLHVVFSDSTFPTIPVNPPAPIHAVISSKDLLDRFDNQQIIERGFVPGDFIIKIMITSDNAKSHESYFRLHVDNEWDKLSMKRLAWLETKALSLKHSQ